MTALALHNRRTGRRGIVLVSVLWILMFLAFLAVVLRLHMSGIVESVRVTEDKAAARILAEAGLALASARVRAGPELGSSGIPDRLSDSVETQTGRVDVTLTNEAYRIDLNTASEGLLTAAFTVGGASPQLAKGLAKEIAEAREARQGTTPPPAEEEPAIKPPPSGEPGKTPDEGLPKEAAVLFSDVAEFGMMADVPAPLAVAASRYLTVSSGLAGVRLDAQPDEILAAIPDLPTSALAAIRAYRAGRMSFDEMAVRLSGVEQHTTDQARSWRAELDVTLASGYGESYEAIAIIWTEDDVPYRLADWTRVPDEVQ